MLGLLSKKEIENRPTNVHQRDNISNFMSIFNQRYLTKKIYLLHKSNNGTLQYLYFKQVVPNRMKSWLSKKDINKYRNYTSDTTDVLNYLNNMFINENYDLYINPDYNLKQLDSNVYKNQVTLSYMTQDDQVILFKKSPKDMYVEDYRNLDVWEKQTVDISDKDKRYGNKIPIWQISMHTRNYDRDNQGYAHANPERSSLETPIHGYGKDVKKLFELMDKKNKYNQNTKGYK